ncbi:MAG TPA: hypothetical protein VKS22_12435 [Candidatus Binataceae bacterium]|nr:hypothetical protein [Candidatus Binataceae bacterium]
MSALAAGVLGVIAFFIYVNRPGPCDAIFQQTAPKLDTSLHFLKTNGDVVIGHDKIQDLTEGAQRLGILCKNCCIAQQSGRIDAAQYQDCLKTTMSYEIQVSAVASNVAAVNNAKQQGQAQLVGEKTQQANQDAADAPGTVQKLAERIPVIASAAAATIADSSPPPNLNAPPKSVVITKIDGTAMWVYDDGFYFNAYGDGLHLESGQSVDYSKITAIDILGADNAKYKLRVTIVGGKTIEGTEDGYGNQNIGGKDDLGAVDFPLEQAKRVVFPR